MLILAYLENFRGVEQDIIHLPEGEYRLNVYLLESKSTAEIKIVKSAKTESM